MPQPKLTIEERLIKYRISRERYNDETTRLLAAEFTQQQAEKLIVRVSSKNAVECVLINYGTLSKKPYDLSREKIVAMASNTGGAQAMKTVLASYAPLLPDETPLNLDSESNDMDFWYRFCVDYETAPQSDTQETIYQPQSNDFGVHEEESPYMVCEDEDDVNSIADNNFERPEEMNEDGFDYFDVAEEPLPATKNSTALQALGVFATTSSGYKRARRQDNSTENTPRKFLKQTPEPTPYASTV